MKKRKKEKEESSTVMTSEISNAIDLNLNSNDVVELMIEEAKDVLVVEYEASLKRLRKLLLKNLQDLTEEVALIVIEQESPALMKAILKEFPESRFNLGGYTQPSSILQAYDFINYKSNLDVNGLPKQVIGIPGPSLLSESTRIQGNLNFLEKGDPSYKLTKTVILTDNTILKINKLVIKVNEKYLEEFEVFKKLDENLKKINNKGRMKSRFIRSILEKTPEGKAVLTNVTAIVNNQKLLA